jgi:putative spermidine/putrescine transport system ATP-binding protein
MKDKPVIGDKSPASLSLRGLTKRYDSVVAIEGVTLDIVGGEFVTFLGPSGSGKTTTLQIVAGFEKPTSGEVLMNGKPLTAPPYKRDIGMVFQNYALFPHMTAAQNVEYPLKVRKINKVERRRRLAEALNMVNLLDRGGHRPRQLSGGQQQRVALARALVFRPSIVLLDEPLGALDKKLREHLQLEIKRIQHAVGITMVYVTHDQEEALVMSDRIAVFNEGKIQQVGTAEEVYERPNSRFVADFIGESNVFVGQIDARGDQLLCGKRQAMLKVPPGSPMRGREDEVVLVVRPERLRVRRADLTPARPEENSITAILQEVIYLGNERKYILHSHEAGRLVSRQQVGTNSNGLRPGDEVVACWYASDGVLTSS